MLRKIFSRRAGLSCPLVAAFDIAAAIPDFPARPQREQLDFLLLLAHCNSDLLRYSCRDLAAAAVLVALRLCGGDIAELPPLLRTADARACAARLRAAHEAIVVRLAALQRSGEPPARQP